jgi:hypothetical protein
MLELKAAAGFSLPTALLTLTTLCDDNPTSAVYVTGGDAEARANESPGCNIAVPLGLGGLLRL